MLTNCTLQAAICRCSQPLSGFSARCLEDEQMLNCILRSNPNAKFMYVVDTRPRVRQPVPFGRHIANI
jgi:myotubularin-related protein 6/7/8